MEWFVRRATVEDIPYLALNLRQEDKKEIYATSGRTPEQSLEECFNRPHVGIWVGVFENNPEIIFGLACSGCEELGIPWMLCTDKLKESPKEFIKKCKLWVEGFSRQYPTLINFVYAENELHIRWLKWCGFEFTELHDKFGFSKEPFWEFQMKRK